mmetsp:Transcript_20821/g.58220  ORF Transcript_20821/g.58220 Transcript_20821/m.58220 type:complete len:332 (-) Transcript_20821:575-1570(-)
MTSQDNDLASKGCVCCATAMSISMLLIICTSFSIANQKGNLVQAEAWEKPYSWRTAECKVVTAGVSCVEKDTGGTCGGFGNADAGTTNASAKIDGTVFFGYRDIAVCPGTYWCAKEDETCTCDGEVLYASALFDGMGYTVSDSDSEYRFQATGPVTCGNNKFGLHFATDPSPYNIKHCWCTPRSVLERLHPAGTITRSPQECAEQANMDFERPATYTGRRLDAVAQPHPDEEDEHMFFEDDDAQEKVEPGLAGGEEERDVAPDGQVDSGRSGIGGSPRKLTTHSSPRRRALTATRLGPSWRFPPRRTTASAVPRARQRCPSSLAPTSSATR